jgi:hypothetical protein
MLDLKQCDTTIETTGTWKALRGRKDDVALMEVFTNKNLTAKEMKDINRCRMYLQAFYLSDVADIAGQHICHGQSKENETAQGAVRGNGQYNSDLQRRHGRYGRSRSKKHSQKRRI